MDLRGVCDHIKQYRVVRAKVNVGSGVVVVDGFAWVERVH